MKEESIILHTFDYSNIIPKLDYVLILVQYCNSYYDQLLKLCSEDEEKNLKLKSEFKFFNYKKSFSMEFKVIFKEKCENASQIVCNSYISFLELVKNGNLKSVDFLKITLNLSFKRGKDFELCDCDNLFEISFKPYNIVFTRKSNYEDEVIDKIENSINLVFQQANVENTIFCSR